MGSNYFKYCLINLIIFITLLVKINENWRKAAKVGLLIFLQLDVYLITGGSFKLSTTL